MNLPPLLAPWAPLLEAFAPDLAPGLGEMARRLESLLGAAEPAFDPLDGEPDGFDGLARRGAAERMLLSEWLLADEVPLEWLRRAAEGELGFLRLARRTPHRSRGVAAICDAGPDVLGAPRLAMLAAILVLARRAQAQGGELMWGLAHTSPDAMWHGVTPSAVRALLEARSAPPAGEDAVESWRRAFSPDDDASDAQSGIANRTTGPSRTSVAGIRTDAEAPEVWLLGGASLVRRARADEASVVIEDPLDDFEARVLEIRARRAGETSVRAARLPLPPDADCVRMLRDPFAAPRVRGEVQHDNSTQHRRVKSQVAPVSNLVWLGGHTFAARAQGGGVAFYRVPSSPRGGVAKPKLYGKDRHVHFIGQWRGKPVGVFATPSGYNFVDLTGSIADFPFGHEWFPRMPGNISTPPHEELEPVYFFSNPDGVIATLPFRHLDPPRLERLNSTDKEVRADDDFRSIVAWENNLTSIWFIDDGAEGRGCISTSNNSAETSPWNGKDFDVQSRQQFHWGFGGGLEAPQAQAPLVLACSWNHSWKIFCLNPDAPQAAGRYVLVSMAPDEMAFGVLGLSSKRATPGLLVRSADKRHLEWRGPIEDFGDHWTQILPTGGDEILDASTSNGAPLIAWRTANELSVYSALHDAIVMRIDWENP